MSNSDNVKAFIKRRKSNLIKVFHSHCCICGWDAYQEGLEFHHVNPNEKLFGICASNAVTKALEKQLEEMKKCILVCANCHRGIHQGYITVPEDWQSLYDTQIAEELLVELNKTKHRTPRFCLDCGVEITSEAQRCVTCAIKASRYVERPNRGDLKKLIRELSFVEIGKQFHVTDNAIRKWCKSEQLPSTKKEIKQYTDKEWELL